MFVHDLNLKAAEHDGVDVIIYPNGKPDVCRGMRQRTTDEFLEIQEACAMLRVYIRGMAVELRTCAEHGLCEATFESQSGVLYKSIEEKGLEYHSLHALWAPRLSHLPFRGLSRKKSGKGL